MALLSVGAQYRYTGNPNGNIAGQLGDQCLDTTTSGALYTCSTAGNAGSAVWQIIGGGSGGITYTALNNTIVIDNTAHTIGGGYAAGANVTITGNVIASTGTLYSALNNTIIIDNTGHTIAGGYVGGSGITITGNSIALTSSTSLITSNPTNFVLIAGDSTPSVSTGFLNATIFGESTGASLITGGDFNTLIGAQVGQSLTNQTRNVAVGSRAMQVASCVQCTAIGTAALANSTASFSIGIGVTAMPLSTSNNDVAIGNNSGVLMNAGSGDNTFIGTNAGSTRDNYSSTLFLGYSADATAAGLSNCGAIGANSTISVSNSINLGNNTFIGINNPSPAYALDVAPVQGTSAIAIYQSVSPVTPVTGKGLLWMDSNNNFNFGKPNDNNYVLNNPSGYSLGQFFPTTSGAVIDTIQGYWSYMIINNNFVVYVLPGFGSNLNQPTQITLKQTDGSDWAAAILPAAAVWIFQVVNNGPASLGTVAIDSASAGQQIIYSFDTSGGLFSGSCIIDSTVVIAPLT